MSLFLLLLYCLEHVRIPDFSAKLPEISAKPTRLFSKLESAHLGLIQFHCGGYNSAVEGAMTRPVHASVPANSTLYLVTAA